MRFIYVACIILSVSFGAMFPEHVYKRSHGLLYLIFIAALSFGALALFAEYTSSKLLVSFILFDFCFIIFNFSALQICQLIFYKK